MLGSIGHCLNLVSPSCNDNSVVEIQRLLHGVQF